ncbi:MAG: hypothetical protein KDJ77_11950 [Rhodobiaceae bacterium]|nr:hypothetical protein [Rhodobiaceae bacterium]
MPDKKPADPESLSLSEIFTIVKSIDETIAIMAKSRASQDPSDIEEQEASDYLAFLKAEKRDLSRMAGTVQSQTLEEAVLKLAVWWIAERPDLASIDKATLPLITGLQDLFAIVGTPKLPGNRLNS